MIKHFTLKVAKTAHVSTFGLLSESTQYIWIACHGYGQTADRFIGKFDQLDPKKHFIIAPEGLSRFYWKGASDDVVASWMTSKDRLIEIDDYLSYLKQVSDRFESQIALDAQFIFFGFSQGCATIMRFMIKYQLRFSHAIFWAGSHPKEINYLALADYLQQGKMHIIYGNADEYLTPEVITKEKEFLGSQNLRTYEHVFSGRHRVEKEVLLNYIAGIL